MKKMKFFAAVLALTCVVAGSAFTTKKVDSKDYGIVSITSGPGARMTYVLADLSILDAQNPAVYTCTSESSAFCKVVALDLGDLQNAVIQSQGTGTWSEKTTFDIPASGHDIELINNNKDVQDFRFAYN